MCLYLQKMRQKNNISADDKHFLSTLIYSTDFQNEILTTKIWRNKAEKPHSFKKIYTKSSWNRRNHQTK